MCKYGIPKSNLIDLLNQKSLLVIFDHTVLHLHLHSIFRTMPSPSSSYDPSDDTPSPSCSCSSSRCTECHSLNEYPSNTSLSGSSFSSTAKASLHDLHSHPSQFPSSHPQHQPISLRLLIGVHIRRRFIVWSTSTFTFSFQVRYRQLRVSPSIRQERVSRLLHVGCIGWVVCRGLFSVLSDGYWLES